MMKRMALVVIGLGVAAAVGYATHPEECVRYAGLAARAGERAWEGVEANPVPACVALGTFLLTVMYHKFRGKSLRESVEVAATRVTVVPVAPAENKGDDNAVVKRAKARATRAQLLADQIGLQNRLRKLPEAITREEKEVCYAQQAVADAERARAEKRKPTPRPWPGSTRYGRKRRRAKGSWPKSRSNSRSWRRRCNPRRPGGGGQR
ncbi:MAG: hypothetical protein ACJ8F7_15170 [Gemmataceae bacterium]